MREGRFSLFQLRRQSKSKSTFVIRKPCAETDFKMVFVKSFCTLGDEIMQLSRGRSQYERTCGEKAVEDGVTIASITTGSVISILSAVGIIGGIASEGIGVAIALAGMALARGITAYHDQKKRKNYELRSELFLEGNMRYYAGKMADQLCLIFEEQLHYCGKRETYQLARSCVELISRAILDGKIRTIHELLKPNKLSSIVRELYREDASCLSPIKRKTHSTTTSRTYRIKKGRLKEPSPSNSEFFEPKPAS